MKMNRADKSSYCVNTGTLSGIEFYESKIEASMVPGAFKISLVGMNARRDEITSCIHRVTAALHNNSYVMKEAHYIISISPGDIRRSGSFYDVGIIACILRLNNYIKEEEFDGIKDFILFGEVSLSGSVIGLKQLFSLSLGARNKGFKKFIIPKENIEQCLMVPDVYFIGISHINDLASISSFKKIKSHGAKGINKIETKIYEKDISDVYGQEHAKRALEISAAGSHHCIFFGPPGCGKTMLAQLMPSILPPLKYEEMIEINSIYSSAALINEKSLMLSRPFRAPHHSSSTVGLVGGGITPFPGDVTLAHRGILFLDELLEFDMKKIEMLRQVMEDREIYIKKNKYSTTYPASFTLIAAFNPCPCGYFGSVKKKCTCAMYEIKKYMSKLSGPILDRIDMQISLSEVDILPSTISLNNGKDSELVKERVIIAREIQEKRYGKDVQNGNVSPRDLDINARISSDSRDFCDVIFKSGKISMRAYHKIIRISRTIADLNGSDLVQKDHIKEALTYRAIDKVVERVSNVQQ